MTSLVNLGLRVGELLKERGETVAVSESAAGGLISASLLSVSGASAYYLGGASVYTRSARRGLLRFDGTMAQMRGSTEEYAVLTASTIREIVGADWAVGESGAAGPSGNRYGDPAGHAAIAVSGPVTATRVIKTNDDDREANMWVFCKEALDFLYETVSEN